MLPSELGELAGLAEPVGVRERPFDFLGAGERGR
jgi:hypothetical protein